MPVRAAIENVGPVLVFLGNAPQDLSGAGGPGSQTRPLPVGAERIFVLAPGQTLFAIGAGVGARVAVSVSEALPLV